MAGKSNFCRFSKIEDSTVLEYWRSFGQISNSQTPNFQRYLEKNLDIVSKKERHFVWGVFTELSRKKTIKLITHTVIFLETHLPLPGLTRI